MFCAVELPAEVRIRLQSHIEALRHAHPEARLSWSRPENIHLTLKFFGNVEQNRIPRISVAADRTAKRVSQFVFGVEGSGVFPKPNQPRVLWIGVGDPSGKLTNLQQLLENECAAEGFAKEDRFYRPHLTIARLRSPNGARELGDAHMKLIFPPVKILVSELVVFRSELSSKGSRYTAISRHKFSGEL